MSKISLQPNASGTGTFTLAAPDSNTNRTLTLPDEAGVVLTDTSDIETQVKAATNATGSAPVYACRAWVNFDGTGTVSIRASGNVSSITDVSSGVYTVNFVSNMPDNNYATVFAGGDIGYGSVVTLARDGVYSSSACRIRTAANINPNADLDLDLICLSFFR